MDFREDEKLEAYRSPLQSPDVAMSTTSPMDAAVSQQRTTLTGKPIPERHHDNNAGLMMADGGGFGMGSAGANLLPPGYTDKSLVRIPIREADLGPSEFEAEPEVISSDIYSPEIQVVKKGRFGGLFKGLKGKTTSSRQKKREGGFQMVMMSRGEYLRYWAKDDHGNFLPTVIEPPVGRREWVRMQLEKNEEWTRKDPELAKGGTNPNLKPKDKSYGLNSGTALAQP